MNDRIAVAVLTALIAIPVAAAPETYVIDPAHSQPQYVTRHIGFSNQHGNFGKATGTIVLDRAAGKGSISVEIDAASIRTHNEKLDAIVKGEEFFNVQKYPTIAFKSSNVTFDGDRVVGIGGELTMLGVTRPVHLDVTGFTCGENPFRKKPLCAAEATATIKRSEWGMTTGLKIGNPSDEVQLTIPVEAYLEQPQG